MQKSRVHRQICRFIGIIGLGGCFMLTGCGQGAGTQLSPGPGSSNSNGSSASGATAGNGTAGNGAVGNGAVGNASAASQGSAGQSSSLPPAGVASVESSLFGGSSFDPQGLFNVYNDTLYVTEAGNTVYVSWESFANGDIVYTSIAQNGVWTITDRPVYSLASMSSDGDWSALFSGNRLIVVDRFRNDAYLIRWDASGNASPKEDLYKGWVGGAFSVRLGGELGVALHLPYGAPTGGAKYDLFLPGGGAKPTAVTVGQSQFTGALYALNPKTNQLYEAKHVQGSGNPVIDAYQLGVTGEAAAAAAAAAEANVSDDSSNASADTGTGSSPGAPDVPVNTVPLVNKSGGLVQTTVEQIPSELAISPSGNLFTVTMDANEKGLAQAEEFDANLKPVRQWPSIRFANPYLQSVSITVSTGTPHIWAVYNDNGKVGLQEFTLK